MRTITVEELKEKMDSGAPIHLIDVREPYEYQEFNIGAQLIPLGKIQSMDISDLEGWENDEVIIHCRSGKRSATACLFLESLGFKNTVNVEGGMLAWQQRFGG